MHLFYYLYIYVYSFFYYSFFFFFIYNTLKVGELSSSFFTPWIQWGLSQMDCFYKLIKWPYGLSNMIMLVDIVSLVKFLPLVLKDD